MPRSDTLSVYQLAELCQLERHGVAAQWGSTNVKRQRAVVFYPDFAGWIAYSDHALSLCGPVAEREALRVLAQHLGVLPVEVPSSSGAFATAGIDWDGVHDIDAEPWCDGLASDRYGVCDRAVRRCSDSLQWLTPVGWGNPDGVCGGEL